MLSSEADAASGKDERLDKAGAFQQPEECLPMLQPIYT